MRAVEFPAAFLVGGIAYGAVELAWRGKTHWTMVLTGGACFLFMYHAAAAPLPPLVRYALCAVVITAAELLTGAVVNLRLGWGVWDYSDQPFNLYGQICAGYSALWFLLSVPGCALARLLRALIRGGGL